MKKISLNNNWYYTPRFQKEMINENNLKEFEKIHLPHTNKILPYNYINEKLYQFISCYKKEIFFDQTNYDNKKNVFLRFEGVMTYCEVFLNGKYIGSHKGGYTPFEFKINDFIEFNKVNLLTVMVDSRELENIPPFGGQIDFLTYGGIYREVYLKFSDKLYIENIKVETDNLYKDEKKIKIDYYISNEINIKNADIKLNLYNKDKKLLYSNSQNIDLLPNSNKISINYDNISGIKLWDIHFPNLYSLECTINSNKTKDIFSTKIGFRECKFNENGFFLNGKNLKIIGLNRHQSYPYSGYAIPKRCRIKDADILKYELGLNLVRTSHYPQSIEFLNRCDEIGLLVFEEIPGWQHIGNEKWKKTAYKNVEEMIKRDWNHPSIVLWGVRINESSDDHEFYKKTNELAKFYDNSRQTGGVRCIEKSEFLEDVYTMNDFIYEGDNIILREQKEVTGLNKNVPYLVTEYMGHMFPTKKFDQEERQVEHVLRHAKIQNESLKNNNISGAIGWCAFDYNTHKDFGSGDSICYHGVMDMFRIKKYAAYFYKSQINPNISKVMKPVTLWSRGEKDKGDILPIVILTNCDYIEFHLCGFEPIKAYPAKKEFPFLKHPPIIINKENIPNKKIGEWGWKWENCSFRGFFNNKMVIEKKMSKNPLPNELKVTPDDFTLNSSEKDATRVVVEALDQYKNCLPFIDEIITVNIEGVGKIIGPKQFSLKGGSFGFWIETINKIGNINITIESQRFDKKNITIEVI